MTPLGSGSFTSVIQLPEGLRDSKFISDKTQGQHIPYVTTCSLNPLSFSFPSKQGISPCRDALLHRLHGSESAWGGVKTRLARFAQVYVCFLQNIAFTQLSPQPWCCTSCQGVLYILLVLLQGCMISFMLNMDIGTCSLLSRQQIDLKVILRLVYPSGLNMSQIAQGQLS